MTFTSLFTCLPTQEAVNRMKKRLLRGNADDDVQCSQDCTDLYIVERQNNLSPGQDSAVLLQVKENNHFRGQQCKH